MNEINQINESMIISIISSPLWHTGAPLDTPQLADLAFRVVDTDGDGLVTVAELKKWVVLGLEHEVVPRELQQLDLCFQFFWGCIQNRTIDRSMMDVSAYILYTLLSTFCQQHVKLNFYQVGTIWTFRLVWCPCADTRKIGIQMATRG